MKAPQRTLPGKLNNARINSRESAVLAHHAKQIAKVSFDFAFDGTATSASFNTKLPANSVITAVHTFVDTALAGTTSTSTLTCGSFSDNIDAELKSAGYSDAGSTAASIGTSASEITLTFDAAPSAGKFRVMLEFLNTDRF